MKDLGPLHYFLRIEVKYFEGGIYLNKNKYVVELLSKTEMTLAKVVDTSLSKYMVWMNFWESFVDGFFYGIVVVRLQYLILTRHYITHDVNLAG